MKNPTTFVVELEREGSSSRGFIIGLGARLDLQLNEVKSALRKVCLIREHLMTREVKGLTKLNQQVSAASFREALGGR